MIPELYPSDVQEHVWEKRKHVYEALSYEIVHAYDKLTEVYYLVIEPHVDCPPPSSDAFLAAAVQVVQLHFTSEESV